MKIVKRFQDSFSANLAKGILESAGIQASVLNDNLGIITGVANSDLLTINLVVDDLYYDEAVSILENSEYASSSAE